MVERPRAIYLVIRDGPPREMGRILAVLVSVLHLAFSCPSHWSVGSHA